MVYCTLYGSVKYVQYMIRFGTEKKSESNRIRIR